jgi:hypothetical protein
MSAIHPALLKGSTSEWNDNTIADSIPEENRLSDSSIDLQKPNLGRCVGTSQTTRAKVLAVEEVSLVSTCPHFA